MHTRRLRNGHKQTPCFHTAPRNLPALPPRNLLRHCKAYHTLPRSTLLRGHRKCHRSSGSNIAERAEDFRTLLLLLLLLLMLLLLLLLLLLQYKLHGCCFARFPGSCKMSSTTAARVQPERMCLFEFPERIHCSSGVRRPPCPHLRCPGSRKRSSTTAARVQA